MPTHTITESAELANVSRRTIQRYVKAGKLSAKKDRHGNPRIDTVELMRVFGQLSHPTPKKPKKKSQPVAVTNNDIASLQNQLEELTALVKKQSEQITHLTNRLEFMPGENMPGTSERSEPAPVAKPPTPESKAKTTSKVQKRKVKSIADILFNQGIKRDPEEK